MVSFTKSAESAPDATTTATSSAAGWRIDETTARASDVKNSDSWRLAMSTIIPNSRMRVR